MSNAEAVRRAYDAFERGDMDAVVADMHPEIEWHQAEGLPHGGVYRGVPEVRRRIFDPLDGEWWDEFHALPDELLDGGEHVVVLGRYTGRARGTGRPLDAAFCHVWTFAGGRAVRFRQYLDTQGWNAALDPSALT